MATITPPKRGEFLTAKGEPTLRFITWIESLTQQSNETTSEVSETSELISGSTETDEAVEGIESELALITPHIVDEKQEVVIESDFTTTGSQFITCINISGVNINVTLNPYPDNLEEIHIKRAGVGRVNFIGNIDGATNEYIASVGDGIHLVYSDSLGYWGAT